MLLSSVVTLVVWGEYELRWSHKLQPVLTVLNGGVTHMLLVRKRHV